MNNRQQRPSYTLEALGTILRWSIVQLTGLWFIAIATASIASIDAPLGLSTNSTATALIYAALGLLLLVRATRSERRDLQRLAKQHGRDNQ